MKKIISPLFMPVWLILFFIVSIAAKGQTLPKIQEASLRAPANVKIDGKLDEWGQFQARNPVDRINYTISNDDSKLYLVVRALGARANAKIINGGITFTVSHAVEKRKRENAPDNVSITFPLVSRPKAISMANSQYYYFNNYFGDIPAHQKQIDSLYTAISMQTQESFKEIKVMGIKNVDTIISVYNTEGIKAAANFDKTMYYVYELAIPLKYLGMDVNEQIKFSYNILLKGPPPISFTIRPGMNTINAPEAPNIIMMGRNGAPDPDMVYLNMPSDFWAEYTLAKK